MEDFREYIEEGRAIDLFVAYRFLRILTTAWEDQDAYKLGIIDKDGKLLRKANTLKTAEEKKAFTLLHRLCLLYTSPSPRDATLSRMPSSA